MAEVFEIDAAHGRHIRIKHFVYGESTGRDKRQSANPCTLKRSWEISHSQYSEEGFNVGLSTAVLDVLGEFGLMVDQTSDGVPIVNRAVSKLSSRLKDSDAALGITLGSYNQTRGMVIDRAVKLGQLSQRIVLDKRVRGLSRTDFLRYSFEKEGTKKALKYIADNHLEYVFGWVPLFADASAVTKTLAEMTLPPSFITGRASGTFNKSREQTYQTHYVEFSSNGTITATVAARVQVTNPNAYLAGRLGLTNLPSVAWDLVPWSFVVNMFGNFNQVIGSFADYAGLSFDSCSTTVTYKGIGKQRAQQHGGQPIVSGTAQAFHYQKVRTLSALPPRPRLVLKLPTLSAGLAGIASALLVQNFSKIGKLLR